MNQQRLKAYLNLIQELLSCPSGEEWILLRQHEELVNPELVQVMEQVASHLATEGNLKAAKFLHNWAGQLHHILTQTVHPPSNGDKSQAYLELIQALLNCPKGSEAKIISANQELIGPGLVQAMKQVASQFTAEGDLETAGFLSNLAAEVNRTWLQAHPFEPTFKKEDKEDKEDNIVPDPWEKESQPEKHPSPIKTEEADLAREVTTAPFSGQPDIEGNQQNAKCLEAIVESLAKLETILAARLEPSDPLWYMNILEQAQAGSWILTTSEVEQLIGVKPTYPKNKNFYQRGCWIFVKVGKIGSQTAWRVKKENVDTRSV